MKKTFTFLLIFSVLNVANAQVSMMGDVSLPYLDRLIAIGEANYPKFKWTSAKVDVAKAAYSKSKCGIFDFLTLSYVYLPGSYTLYNNNGTYNAAINGYQLGVFLNVGSILQKPAIVREAKAEYVAAKLDKNVIDLDVDQEIRKRYFVYVEQSNLLKLKSRSVDDASDLLKQVKYKFEKGELTFEIYNQALLSFSTYSQEKINAEANILIAKSSLEEILGTTLENIK